MGNKDEYDFGDMVNDASKWVGRQTEAGRREQQRSEMNALALGATIVVGIPTLVIGVPLWLAWKGAKEIGKHISGGGNTGSISDDSNPSTPAS